MVVSGALLASPRCSNRSRPDPTRGHVRQVNSAGTGGQVPPSIAMARDGAAIVAFRAKDAGDGAQGVFVHRYAGPSRRKPASTRTAPATNAIRSPSLVRVGCDGCVWTAPFKLI